VDVISPDHDLSEYSLVIAPLLNMVTAQQGRTIERYVESGGTFITSNFSGIVDENDRAWLGGYPGPLRKTLGIWVEEFDPLLPESTNLIIVGEGGTLPQGSYTCERWCDLVHLEGAQALATYGDDFYAGRPAITEHQFGQGRALYVATRPERRLLDALVSSLVEDLEIMPIVAAPVGVEVTCRASAKRTYTFMLNHNAYAVHMELAEPMLDLLTGETWTRRLKISAKGIVIIIPA
jgi:beta-galactosidase